MQYLLQASVEFEMKASNKRQKMAYEARRGYYLLLAYSIISFTVASFFLFYYSRRSESKDLLLFGSVLFSAYAGFVSSYLSKRISKSRGRDKVFIIYGQSDISSAREISAILKANGFLPWLDVERVMPGQRINIAIEEGLDECSSALLLVSENLDINSSSTSHVLSAALNSMSSKDSTYSPVIPVLLDDTPPPASLSNVFAIQYESPDSTASLINALKRVARGV